ncbi:hypothetical protein BP00DRAFT_142844 [Aspergillus indologenus CBS 114.80]|uniref:Uncharacterized protein n=1 Tax=Aspergillus indologenus CBS 114.80 TaxID=1450541 RepID=A0A2V5J571_9EURO|nr:hypothetical protein BP00DRAFT_142844 [Aspergillus indologenus CBS 114.80]
MRCSTVVCMVLSFVHPDAYKKQVSNWPHSFEWGSDLIPFLVLGASVGEDFVLSENCLPAVDFHRNDKIRHQGKKKNERKKR